MALMETRPAGDDDERAALPQLPKAPTGITGLDRVIGGGVPRGRTTLVVGSAGSGKTLLGMEFLVHGAREYGEPGVMLTFEETGADLAANTSSLGFDLRRLQDEGLLVVDAFGVDLSEVIETGAFDLEGLFIRLAYAVESIGAQRVALDSIEVLFGALGNEAIIRSEVGRLIRWMKDRGLTAIMTAESGAATLTRHGIQEYVTDCVIVLDHRVREELSTRRLRVAKYRGSPHGTSEYPFLITDRGLVVLPITSVGLDYPAPAERISTGVARLDYALGGGVFRGSTTLITGEAGTGKTILAARMIEAACERGERGMFLSFEESPAQIQRNMASVGIDVSRWVEAGSLRVWSGRPSAFGLEMHLLTLLQLVDEFRPDVVALDAMTALDHLGDSAQVASAVTREIDVLKSRGITAVVTSLTHAAADGASETSSLAMTSLVDVWILLRNVESNGERNRLLFVRKCRGSDHSNEVREFVISDNGLELLDVYVGAEGVMTGSARLAREAADRRAGRERRAAAEQRHADLVRRQTEVEAEIAVLRAQLEEEEMEVERLAAEDARREDELAAAARKIARYRRADSHPEPRPEGNGDDGG